MDTKDLRTEPVVEDRNNDVKATHLRNGNSYKCVERSKSYQDPSTVPLSKVEVQTTRPCAVIGPDRIITRPTYSTNSPAVKNHEYWNIENGRPDSPYRTSEYQDPTRNISPRLTYQENMLRVMVPNRYPGAGKPNENINCCLDNNNQPMQMHVKAQVPSENKLCDVPYNQNLNLIEHRIDKGNETSVSNVNSSRSVPHGWPGNIKPPLSYSGSEIYPYPEFPSNTVPRALPLIRPHRSRHDEPVSMYGDSYYRNIRYEPYSLSKERYPQPRYEFLNYPNSYHPSSNYPSPKYDLPKFPHQYGYSQIAYKVRDPQVDYYKQPFPPKSHNLSYQNHELHSNYAQLPGTCLQNKYTHPGEGNPNSLGVPKSTYDLNNKQFVSPKSYPENYYLNELQRQQMKGPILNRNYMHVAPPYPYYRRENIAYKHNEITPSQIKNPDLMYNNQMHRMPLHFSPNIISSGDYGVSQEDCGYVSQSSTTSVNSSDSVYNMYRVYDSKYGYANRNYPFFKETGASIMSTNKQKRDIDVRQFLQMWNEGEEEINENGGNKEVNAEQTPKDSLNAQDQLYVLGLVNVPSEELGKYEHIQKVSKLPENIKGYTNLELLSQFEQAIGSTNLSHPEHKSLVHNKIAKESLNPLTLPLDPLSPLDVESKISQSIIHKEVGCNFEIKPCSPQMFMAEVTSAPTLSDERSIEKVHNSHKPQSPLSSCDKENLKGTQINITPQKGTLVGKHSNLSISTSCEMEKASKSPRHTLHTVKPKYTYQDLEGNAGICLASLPHIDSDIELSFPEVNQQFINANKPDTVSPNINNNTLDVMKVYNNPLTGTNENDVHSFKNKQYKNKSMQSVRTDSVIIKNPENTNDKLDCNSKDAENSSFTEKYIDIMSSTPINLALTSKSKTNEVLEHKNKDHHLTKGNISIDKAINLSLNPIDPLYEEESDSSNKFGKNEWHNSAFHERANDTQLEVINSCYNIDSTECNNNFKSQYTQNSSPLESKTQHDDITRPEIMIKDDDSSSDVINQSPKKNDIPILLTDSTVNEKILVHPCEKINEDVAINTTIGDIKANCSGAVVESLKTSYSTVNEKILVHPCEKINEYVAINTTIGDIKANCSGAVVESLKTSYSVQPKEKTHLHITPYIEEVEKRQKQSESNLLLDFMMIESNTDSMDHSLIETERDNIDILENDNLVSIPKYEYVKLKLQKDTFSPETEQNNKIERSISSPIKENQSDNLQMLKDEISENYTGELNAKLIKIPGKVSEMKESIDISSSYRHKKTKETLTSKKTCSFYKSHNNHKVIENTKKSYNFFKKHYSSLYQNLLLGESIKINAYNLSQKVCQNINDNIIIPCMDLNEIKDKPPSSKYTSTDENLVITSNSKSDVSNMSDKSNYFNKNAKKESGDLLVTKTSSEVDKKIESIHDLSEELICSESDGKSEYKANIEHEYNQTQNNNTNQLGQNDNIISNSAMDSNKIKSTKIASQSKFENEISSPSIKTTNFSNLNAINDISVDKVDTVKVSCVGINFTDFTLTHLHGTIASNKNINQNEITKSKNYKISNGHSTSFEFHDDRSMDANERSIFKKTDADLTESHNEILSNTDDVISNLAEGSTEFSDTSNLSSFKYSVNNKNIIQDNKMSVEIYKNNVPPTEENSFLAHTSTLNQTLEKTKNNKDVNITCEVIAASILDENETSNDSFGCANTKIELMAEFAETKKQISISEQKFEKINDNNTNEVIEATQIQISTDSFHCANIKNKSVAESTNEKCPPQIVDYFITETSISEPKLDHTRSKKNIVDTDEVIAAKILNEIETSNDSFQCTNIKYEAMSESTNENNPVETYSSFAETSLEQNLDETRNEIEVKAAKLNEIQTSNDSFNYENIEQELTTKSGNENSPAKICDHEHTDQSDSYDCDNNKTSHFIKAPSSDEYKTTNYHTKQDSKDSVSSTCIHKENHDENKCESLSLFQTVTPKKKSLNILKKDIQPENLINKLKSKAILPVIVNYSDSDDDSNSDISESYENLQQTSQILIKNCDSNISSQFLNNEVNIIRSELDFYDSVETKDKLNKYFDTNQNCDTNAMGSDKSVDESVLQIQATEDSIEHLKLSISEKSTEDAIPEETDSPKGAMDKNYDKNNSNVIVKSNECENHYVFTTKDDENIYECQEIDKKIINNTLDANDVIGYSENDTKEKSTSDLTDKSETIYIPLSSNVEVAITDKCTSPDNHKEALKDNFVRKTLKRSLSDSVIYNSHVLDDIYNKCKSPLWPHKRKKRLREEVIENQTRLEFGTRRISLSPSAQTEQVSFCILINNDYILSQESQDAPEAICLTDLYEDNIVTNDIICSDSVPDHVSPSPDLEDNYINFTSDANDQTTVTDWVDDVACVETVITDNNLENYEEIVEWRNEDDNSNSDYFLQRYNEDISNDYIYHAGYSPVNNIELNHESHQLNDVVPSNISDSESLNIKDHIASDNDDECSEVSSQRTASRSQSLNSVDKNNLCDFGVDIVHDDIDEVSSSSKSFTSRSPPEVSSTTPEDKRSNILLKITNLNGSRTSQTTFELPDRKIRCKLTEKNDYLSTRSFMNQSRPLITKAAQKYIPPLPVPDLRVSLRLPSHILDKVRFLKIRPPASQYKKTNLEASTQRGQLLIKKPKPKFEDVLMNIDKANVELQKDKLKKLKRNIPKVIIKKTQNGSHYTSAAEKRYNPDLTGRKWQPWVVIERNKFIDKMSIKGKTKAVYCHRKRSYILFEKKYKYKAADIASANFVISQFKSDHNKYKNQLKYTFRLKSGI